MGVPLILLEWAFVGAHSAGPIGASWTVTVWTLNDSSKSCVDCNKLYQMCIMRKKRERKKILAPRNKEIPDSILDKHDNLLTDSIANKNESRTEFQYRLGKREIRSDLKLYESFQNRLCQLRIKACKSSINPNF